MTWIQTDTAELTTRWTPQDTKAFADSGGIGHREWFNVDTGAAYLLASNGEWRTGGTFHLLWKSPTATEATDVTALLWPAKRRRYSADPQEWTEVQGELIDLIDTLLEAQSLSDRVRT